MTLRKTKPALAVQGGPMWGVLLPAEHNPTFRPVSPECRFCIVCERETTVKAAGDGKTYCNRHRHCAANPTPGAHGNPKPKKREFAGRLRGKPPMLRKGFVWRLCVRCDGKMQKRLAEAHSGPFLCCRCKRSMCQTLSGRKDVYYVPDSTQPDPRKADRVAKLSELYSTVDANGYHKTAGTAGPPPTAADLPFEVPTYDPPAHRDDDDDFGSEDDSG